LPRPEFPTRLLLRREAVLSSRIDGLRASCRDLVLFEAGSPARRGDPDVRQVANHVRALEHGLDADPRRPVNLKLILHLHRILMTGARSEHQTPGQFRSIRTPVEPPGCMEPTVLLPPPVSAMRAALEALEKHLRRPSHLPPLVRIALVHSQFETIHPFLEGNDRVGRLLISLLLRTWGLLPSPWLCPSVYFERHRQEYCARLVAVCETDEWEKWVGFFLTGVAEQARDGVRRILELRRLRGDYLARLRRAPSRALLVDLVEGLFDLPAVTVPAVARRSRTTRRSAGPLIHRLVDAGILSAAAGGARNGVFVAHDILRTIEVDPTPGRS
jgi:Fic family protein